MRLLDPIVRWLIVISGIGARHLREQLSIAGVRVPVSGGCLLELVRHADATAWQVAAKEHERYLWHFRQQLTEHAKFVRLWTASDQKVDTEDEFRQALVRIARNYALPRPWRLSEPAPVAYRRAGFSAWKWATGVDTA